MPLTDIAIRNAKPREKPHKMGNSLGLFLLVASSGGKLWKLKFRVDGLEKKLSLGSYPDVSLTEARKKRDDARKGLAAGTVRHWKSDLLNCVGGKMPLVPSQ